MSRSISRQASADEVERWHPGLLRYLEVIGVELSNSGGAVIVEGYLGEIIGAIEIYPSS